MFRSKINRTLVLTLLSITVVFGITVTLAMQAIPDSKTPGMKNEADPVLEVSIAIPRHRGKRVILRTGRRSHFEVLVRNVSDENLTLWKEWCSFGHNALYFELVDQDGRTYTIRKKEIHFLQNIADPFTLEPRETKVYNIYFDDSMWQSFPFAADGKPRTLSMRAVYQIETCRQSLRHRVWSGKVTSEKRNYVFEWRN